MLGSAQGCGPTRYTARLAFVDRSGKIEAPPLPERNYASAKISADGKRAIVEIEEGTIALRMYDIARNTLTPIGAGGGSSQAPVWTADGTRVIYRATRNGLRNIYWRAVVGSGDEEPLTQKADVLQSPTSVSPDGHWLAYMSWESGRSEVYVRPFPAVEGGRWQVSLEGGQQPRCAPGGRELFFRAQDGAVMTARVATTPAFSAIDRTIFKPAPGDGSFYSGAYDVHPDGRRLLMARRITGQEGEEAGVVVVENFTEELKQRVPR